MNRLQPTSYGADAVRSYSAGSYGSSNSSASSIASGRATARTPLNSPSLSEQGTPSPDSSNSSKFSLKLQTASPTAAADAESGLSPLELLMKRGKQVQHKILEPSDASTFDPNSHRIYERASALSRKTSVRKPPIQPLPDPDDFDDTQSIRSVNLLSEDGSSFSHRQRRSAPTSASSSPEADASTSSFRVERGYRGTFDDRPSHFANESDSSWQRQSTHLLSSNAFRGSFASDVSYNSVSADLSRRASIDTVRSSEFGEHGRWGRAWSSKAEDEESVYGESTYGGDLDQDGEDLQSSVANLSLDLDPSRSPGSLSSVAQRWKLDHAAQGSRSLSRSANTSASGSSSRPTIREVQSKEKVVSLTRAVPPATTLALQQPTSWHDQADPRHSMVPQIDVHQGDAEPRSSRLYNQTPLASADRFLGHRNTSSTSTITGDQIRRSSEGSPQLARVYVYPPSPSGSEASRSSGGAAVQHPGHPRLSQQRYPSMPNPASAKVESFAESPTSETSPLGEPRRTPLAPSSLLSGPRSVSAGTVGARPRASGHPAGRAPPPPPPAAAATPSSEIPAGGYSNPNEYFQGVDRPIIGRKRQEAIARADGRQSMVSDLDVETLRLDGSSRRSSTSTINSVMTSRMSIGSVNHDAHTMQSAAWRDQASSIPPSPSSPRGDIAPHLQAKASQSSFRSLQPVQDTSNTPSHTANGAATLRNAKSSHALGSVPMQAAASAPPTAGLGSATPLAKPRTSPAVDTRTGPSTAEEFLSRGITYHEQGDLARSAFYFERSAKVDGGCVVGMCMFGMALREGWGARKDPVKGFTWIQRAAARAGEMMSNTSTAKSDSELRAIKSELKLSVYELGKCFCYGWGVKMDKQMALEYFELAAKLGDADAQAEAGALYAAGKGCKKDLKKAAMYYRMAEEGGYDTVGLSWIHKDKYK